MKSVFNLLISLQLVFFSVTICASSLEDAELKLLDELQEKINLKKQWTTYRYDNDVVACYSKYFMDHCLKKSRNEHLKEYKLIRDQELALHERQRYLKELIKDERDDQRNSERIDPQKVKERAANVKAYEEKQKLRAERAQDLEERRKDADSRAQENKNSSPF
jgi:hypothetical protein